MIYKSIPRYQRNNAFCFVLVELQSIHFYSNSRGRHSGHYGSKFKHLGRNPIEFITWQKTNPNTGIKFFA